MYAVNHVDTRHMPQLHCTMLQVAVWWASKSWAGLDVLECARADG